MHILFLSLSRTVLCLGSGITADSAHPQSPHQASATQASSVLKTNIADSYGKLPISFEANRGQTNGRVNLCVFSCGLAKQHPVVYA